MPYANSKGADQPAHLHSLISAFVFHCLDSIIPTLSKSVISSLYLVSLAEQPGLSPTWSEIPKTDFLVTGYILVAVFAVDAYYTIFFIEHYLSCLQKHDNDFC